MARQAAGKFYESQLNKLSSFTEEEGAAKFDTLQQITEGIKRAGFPKDQKEGDLSSIKVRPDIKPEIFGKVVSQRITDNKESKAQYILDTYNARYKPLSELLDTHEPNAAAIKRAVDPYRKNMTELELPLGLVDSSVEYLVWNQKYFMIIKYVSSDYSVHLKILSFNPQEVEKVGEVLFEKEIYSHVGVGESTSLASALSHNNLYLTCGQWLFFYTISSDHGKNENTIQLVRVDLNAPQPGGVAVGDPYDISGPQTIKTEAMIQKKLKRDAPTVILPPSDLQVQGADAIIFSTSNQILIDNSALQHETTGEAADAWIQNQYVVHLGQAQLEGNKTQLIMSLRKVSDISKSLIAVQAPQQKHNNVSVGLLKQMTLDGEVSDFIGIYANNNDDAHLIKIVPPPKKPDLNSTIMSQSGVDQSFLQQSFLQQSIVDQSIVERSVLEEDDALGTQAERTILAAVPTLVVDVEEVEVDYENDSFAEILLDEDFKEKQSSAYQRFLKQILKIRTTNFAVYEFLSNGGRTYIFKSYQERKSQSLFDEMETFKTIDNCSKGHKMELYLANSDFKDEICHKCKNKIDKVDFYQCEQDNEFYHQDCKNEDDKQAAKKKVQEAKPKYSPVSHNIMVFQSAQSYMVQTLIKKADGYSIEMFSTAGNQSMRNRVIEKYRKADHHPFVCALKANHGQESIQVDPDCNNAFYYKIPAGDGAVRKVMDINGVHRSLGPEDFKFPSLSLDFSNNEVRNSKRLQLANDDRNVQVRLQRYVGLVEGDGTAKKTVIEVWHNSKYQQALKAKGGLLDPKKQKGWCGSNSKLRLRSDYVLDSEIIQSKFQDASDVQFGNLCPSSSVGLDGKGNHVQRYQMLTIQDDGEDFQAKQKEGNKIQRHRRYQIYEYELVWNEKDPKKYKAANHSGTRLRLVGQKNLIFNGEFIHRNPILVPLYSDPSNCLIEGTQLLDDHEDYVIPLGNFESSDFQFKTGVCNSGYKIYKDTTHDTDWKCLLIESSLNTHAIENGTPRELERRQGIKDELTNEDLKRMYAQQLQVVMNIVPFNQLDVLCRAGEKQFDQLKHDHLAPLEIIDGNSIVDHLIFQPQRLAKAFEIVEFQPSLIELFIRNQEEIRGDFDKKAEDDENERKFVEYFRSSFGRGTNWRRRQHEIWQDLLQMNPIIRCYDQEDQSMTEASANVMLKKIFGQEPGHMVYEMLIMILPQILETKDSIDVEEYANFFIDAPGSSNFGIRLEGKVDGTDLPKYSDQAYQIRRLPYDGQVCELNLQNFAMQYLVSEEAQEEQASIESEQQSLGQSNTRTTRKSLMALSMRSSVMLDLKKNKTHDYEDSSSDCFGDLAEQGANYVKPQEDYQEDAVTWDAEPGSKGKSKTADGPKNITVKHYLVNLESISYINRIKYIQGVTTSHEGLDVNELYLADKLVRINEKYNDYYDQAPIIRNIIDIKFTETVKFFKVKISIYVLLFMVPFLMQLFTMDPEIATPLYVYCCVFCAEFVQVIEFYQEFMQIKRMGWSEYLDEFDNKNDMFQFVLYTAYAVMRVFYPQNLLPESRGYVDSVYGFFLFANCALCVSVAFKLFKYFKIDADFGLLVQLVSSACRDVINFTTFMFIWIIVLSLLYRILGSNNSNQASNYPSVDNVTATFLTTFEYSIGNINPPSYELWATKMHANQDDWTNVIVCKVSIYCIWLLWFGNQFLILIILLNFLIAVLGKSQSDVMDGALMFKYQQRCELNREYAIFKQSFSSGKLSAFLVSADVDDDDENDGLGGVVSQVKDFIKVENRAVRAFLVEKTKEIQRLVSKQNTTSERNIDNYRKTCNEKLRDLNDEMEKGIAEIEEDLKAAKKVLDGDAKTRRAEMQVDLQQIKEKMFASFKKTRSTMAEDVQTFKKQAGDVNKGVSEVKTGLNEELQEVSKGVTTSLGSVNQSLGQVGEALQTVQNGVADVSSGVASVKEQTLKGFEGVQSSVAGFSKNLKAVSSEMESGLEKMGKNMEDVGGSVSKVGDGVSNISVSSLSAIFSMPKFSMPKLSLGGWGFGGKKK